MPLRSRENVSEEEINKIKESSHEEIMSLHGMLFDGSSYIDEDGKSWNIHPITERNIKSFLAK